MTTKAQVNRALAAKGYQAEIWRGDGYWYFFGPDADCFLEQGVYGCAYLSHMPVADWIEAFEAKREEAELFA